MLEACVLHLHLLAYHGEPGFRSAVPGVGLLCDTPIQDLRAMTGVFSNSLGHASVYAGAVWQPLHIGPVKIGVAAGAITGYEKPVEPLGALVMSFPLVNTVSGHLTFIPKIEGKTPHTVQFSVSFPF